MKHWSTIHTSGYILPSKIYARPRAAFKTLSGKLFISPVFCTEVRYIGTALSVRRTVIGRHCSVETAQPRDQTTNPGIVMPESNRSSQGSTLPYPTLPYPTLPYPTLPYPTLPYPTLPYPTLPYPTLPYPTLPYPTLPYPTLPYPTLCLCLCLGLSF